MHYEFTKQKVRAQRRAVLWRAFVGAAAGCAGLAIGAAANDVHTLVGMFAASVIATAAGLIGFYLVA